MDQTSPPSLLRNARSLLFCGILVLFLRQGNAQSYPGYRYVEWELLDDETQDVASGMGYTPASWNFPGTAEIEKETWIQLGFVQREDARTIGFQRAAWDCYVNHYRGFEWDELNKTQGTIHDSPVIVYYETLGWNEDNWNEIEDFPPSDDKMWQELTDEEKNAGKNLCYRQETWNFRRGNARVYPAYRYIEWELLDAETLIAAYFMGYTIDSWNFPGTAEIEGETWEQLGNNQIQREYARAIGFKRAAWDCYVNHYRGFEWNELDKTQGALRTVMMYYETLGWNEDKWNGIEDYPLSDDKEWQELTDEEKNACRNLCYRQETWDFTPLYEWSEITASPTQAVTNEPTEPPVTPPTRPPTPMPTQPPTPMPSQPPTQVFTTESPTPIPTKSRTRSPTNSPTIRQGNRSSNPSSSPTASNFSVTSSRPSIVPGVSPEPSIVPGVSPEPSITTTGVPSTSPTRTRQQFLIKVAMTLHNTTGTLARISITRFEENTAKYLEDLSEFTPDELTGVDVGTNILDQTFSNGDLLPAGSAQLKILFDAYIDFYSKYNYDEMEVGALVGKAFGYPELNQDYISMLRALNNDVYKDLEEITVVIGGIAMTPPTASPTISLPPTTPIKGEESEFPVVVVGAVSGGLAFLLLLLGSVIYMRRRGRNKNAWAYDTKTSTLESQQNIAKAINVENQDDISTLGDPMYGPIGGMLSGHISLEKDDTVTQSYISGDYDYAKAYGDAQHPPSVSTGTTGTIDKMNRITYENSSLYSDDLSFEQQYNETAEQYQVDVPAGKLGVVIDTPSGGVPVVHALKNSSVLAQNVSVGDRLISVDGEDTTALTAMEISKLIASKSNQASRTLLFSRIGAKAM